MTIFKTGSGQNASLEEIKSICKDYVSKGAKIFVGTDSFMSNKKVCFATVICLHGNGNKGKYFFLRDVIPITHYKVLVNRITEEVRRSIEWADKITNEFNIPHNNIEVHIDASPVEAKRTTQSDMCALDIKCFVPLITHSSPSFSALQRSDPVSLPASGSDRENAAGKEPSHIRGKNFSFCSSVPYLSIMVTPILCVFKIPANDMKPRDSSSPMRA